MNDPYKASAAQSQEPQHKKRICCNFQRALTTAGSPERALKPVNVNDIESFFQGTARQPQTGREILDDSMVVKRGMKIGYIRIET
jgi:hypothetical protein